MLLIMQNTASFVLYSKTDNAVDQYLHSEGLVQKLASCSFLLHSPTETIDRCDELVQYKVTSIWIASKG